LKNYIFNIFEGLKDRTKRYQKAALRHHGKREIQSQRHEEPQNQ